MSENKPMTEQELQDEAYRRYQLDWMASHGRSVYELVMSVLERHADDIDPEDPEGSLLDSYDKADALFDNWESDSGFNGSLWVCKNEFLGAEYLDPDYMRHLLPDELFAAWSAYQSRRA